MNSEEKKYKNLMKQGLSIRAAARILKIASSTLAYRLKKLKEQGTQRRYRNREQRFPAERDVLGGKRRRIL